MTRTYLSDADRFWMKVDKGGPIHATLGTPCWDWVACRNTKGYGMFWLAGSIAMAHRVAWEFENDPIPDGILCIHRCDRPRCVNTQHLFLGTPADSTADMVAKGRGVNPRGEAHGCAKLSDQQARAIRDAVGTNREVAASFGVSPPTVSAIKNRRKWRHMP